MEKEERGEIWCFCMRVGLRFALFKSRTGSVTLRKLLRRFPLTDLPRAAAVA